MTAAAGSGSESLFSILKHGPLKVCVLGSGNWGTACAILISENAQESYLFDTNVRIWVREEKVGDRFLDDIINEDRENVKYLPGFRIPDNLKAYRNIHEAVKDADLIAFILPHQFMENVCKEVAPYLKPTARAISLAKGLHIIQPDNIPMTFSRLVEQICKIECSALSGANVAKDVANKQFCESTIGFKNNEVASIWQQLFDRAHFRVHTVPDPEGLQVCGAVKNLIALSAGFCDGLGMGSNTKSAIIRLGTLEMKLFATLLFDGVLEETFFESCGFADVITTCYGGRNVRCAAEFIRRKQKSSWEEIEADMLGGMKMQGQYTCQEVHQVLKHYKIEQYFPLFEITYKIAFEGADPSQILEVFSTAEVSAVKNRSDCSPSVLAGSLRSLHKALCESSTEK